MDTFDRVFASMLSTVVVCAAVILLKDYHHVGDVILILAGQFALIAFIWKNIAIQSRELKILQSVCGDRNGRFVCTLEPQHPGDHKHFHSSGGVAGWPRREEKNGH